MNDFTFDQLFVGQTAQFTRTFSPEDIQAFADLSGDHSPLHVDADYARAAGFSGVVGHGLLSGALYSTLVGVHLPGKRALLRGIQIDFHAPVFAGEPLLVAGTVAEMHAEFRLLMLKAEIRDAAGKLLSKAKIQVGLREA
ncbi:MAG TPA: MaoC family dehydratase [bacterium]|jgi:3-hydroxybutyryl-CoA dehydratase|nr:MaoC family dehydratase [bacterium]